MKIYQSLYKAIPLTFVLLLGSAIQPAHADVASDPLFLPLWESGEIGFIRGRVVPEAIVAGKFVRNEKTGVVASGSVYGIVAYLSQGHEFLNPKWLSGLDFHGSSITSADFNNDGLDDFAVAGGMTTDLTIYLSRGDGTFTEADIRR